MHSAPYTLNIKGRLHVLNGPAVMGILNVTPDSFYAHSRLSNIENLLQRAGLMLQQGATFLDVGAYSTRPGAADISPQEECDRLVPAIQALSAAYPSAVISVDTFRARVAQEAIAAGAHIINDVSGGSLDDDMFTTVAKLQVPYILMHMRGTPQTMAGLTHYNNLLTEMVDYFAQKVYRLRSLKVKDIILDPGFGFAKTVNQQYHLLKNLSVFNTFQLPLLAGLSRKSMVQKVLGVTAAESLNGTTVLNTLALMQGAAILRVHDVAQAVQCVQLYKHFNATE